MLKAKAIKNSPDKTNRDNEWPTLDDLYFPFTDRYLYVARISFLAFIVFTLLVSYLLSLPAGAYVASLSLIPMMAIREAYARCVRAKRWNTYVHGKTAAATIIGKKTTSKGPQYFLVLEIVEGNKTHVVKCGLSVKAYYRLKIGQSVFVRYLSEHRCEAVWDIRNTNPR